MSFVSVDVFTLMRTVISDSYVQFMNINTVHVCFGKCLSLNCSVYVMVYLFYYLFFITIFIYLLLLLSLLFFFINFFFVFGFWFKMFKPVSFLFPLVLVMVMNTTYSY